MKDKNGSKKGDGWEICSLPIYDIFNKDRVDRYLIKICTGCRKLYSAIMEDDGDCCPSCARY